MSQNFAYAFNLAGIINLLINVILPLAVAFISRSTWARDLKGVLLLFLSALSAFLTQLVHALATSAHVDWQGMVVTALFGFATALGSYFGIWKNGALQAKLLAFPARRAARRQQRQAA